MSTKNEQITVREAAQECGRNMETVRRWIWAGKLPAEKLGNQLFIKRSDFTSFCREIATRQYRAEPEPGFMERAMALQRLPGGETDMKQKNRASIMKKMRRLREEIHARTSKVFDAETMIRELRDERDREVR